MVKRLLTTIGLAAAVAAGALLIALATDSSGLPPQFIPGQPAGDPPLAKTWTTGVQKKEPGSHVLVTASLSSHGSFQAEGKGFEPSTGCPAPDFESLSPRQLPFRCPSLARFPWDF